MFHLNLFHRIKMMKRFQVGNTNRGQAINSSRGGTLLTHHLTHRRQKKTEKYLFYRNLLFIATDLQKRGDEGI